MDNGIEDFLATKYYSAKSHVKQRDWFNHFRAHANVARAKSKDLTGVGAVLFGKRNEVLFTAFNGPAIGVVETNERRSREGGIKYKFAVHAEENLISFAAKHGIRTEGLRVYTSHHPCTNCANRMVQAGIEAVVIGNGTYVSGTKEELDTAKQILIEGGVHIYYDHVSEVEDEAFNLSTALVANRIDPITGVHFAKLDKWRMEHLPIVPLDVAIITQLFTAATFNLLPPKSYLQDRFGGTVADNFEAISNGFVNFNPRVLIASLANIKVLFHQAEIPEINPEYKTQVMKRHAEYVRALDNPNIKQYIKDHSIYMYNLVNL